MLFFTAPTGPGVVPAAAFGATLGTGAGTAAGLTVAGVVGHVNRKAITKWEKACKADQKSIEEALDDETESGPGGTSGVNMNSTGSDYGDDNDETASTDDDSGDTQVSNADDESGDDDGADGDSNAADDDCDDPDTGTDTPGTTETEEGE